MMSLTSIGPDLSFLWRTTFTPPEMPARTSGWGMCCLMYACVSQGTLCQRSPE